MYVCICVSVYVYRVHICRREAKLLLSEYIEPQCLYRSRQASNVYTHAELWRRSRTFDTIPSPPITGRSPQSHSAKESDTAVENTENRIQQNRAESSEQSKASAGDVSLILRQSSGDVSRINRAASPQMRHSGSKLGQTMSIVTCPPCPAHFD